MSKAKRATQAAKSSKGSKAAAPAKVRVTILGHSASSVLKWMGKSGWTREQADKALAKLATGGEVAASTISTGLSDGRSEKYSSGAAKLSKDEASKLKAAAK